MNKKKLFIMAFVGMAAFMLGYGAVTMAWPVKGKNAYIGYFLGNSDTSGDYVLRPDSNTPGCAASGGNGLPTSINSAPAFINFITCKLNSTNANANVRNQERTGAAFIIQTMIGQATNRPPTAAQIADWQARVNYAASQGWIQWNTGYSYTINSFFQGNPVAGNSTPNDDAFFPDSGSGSAIIFWGAATPYVLRHLCGNPLGNGNIGVLAPGQNYSISGRTTVSDANPKPGDTIRFDYYVRDDGPTATSPTDIWWLAYNVSNGTAVSGGNSGQYAAGQEKLVTFEDVPIPLGTPPGTTYCRLTQYAPSSSSNPAASNGPTVCATVRYDFALTPTVNIEINDGATTGSAAEVGDKVEFIYAVNNVGTTASMSTNCTVYGLSKNGFNTVPTPNDTTSDVGYTQPAHGCPRVFAASTNTTLVTETIASIPATSLNKTLCRTLSISPVAPAGGTQTAEACVTITAKPYLRIYGGDVSAGNGFTSGTGSTCTNNAGAAVVSWNQRGGGPGWAGAGTQFATYALSKIFDFADNLGNPPGGGNASTKPSGFSFSNTTTDINNGDFGGSLGSIPCIQDYWDTTGATNYAGPLATTSTGKYVGFTPAIVSGTMSVNQRVVLYNNGDVYINGNITYPASWPVDQPPLFMLVARGNIYIRKSVTRLDGTYVAQRNGAGAGGTIYTCANSVFPPTAILPTDPTAYGDCNTKLTINGSFVANQVQFMRTFGTLSQAVAGETASSGNAGEVFNYSPVNWMTSLPGQNLSTTYDAITSLPPVL